MAVTLQLLLKNLIESFLRKNITHTHKSIEQTQEWLRERKKNQLRSTYHGY